MASLKVLNTAAVFALFLPLHFRFIMATLYYFAPFTLNADFIAYPTKPNTHIFDGALLLSSVLEDNDLSISAIMFIGGGQASPLQGVYNVCTRMCCVELVTRLRMHTWIQSLQHATNCLCYCQLDAISCNGV